VGIKTLLDTVSITSRDNRRDGQKEKTTPALNKGKRDHLKINKTLIEDLGLRKDPKSKDKGKMSWI